MSKTNLIFIAVLLLVYNPQKASCQLSEIRDFIQSNVVGSPGTHQETSWVFDPDISQKRSKLWQETNGIKGEKLIERLGLGIDGNAEERLAWQRQRDRGHLGGLNYFQP